MNRQTAERMDREDPLSGLREEFATAADRPIYMDGNSLGRPPKAAVEAIRSAVAEWSERLVDGWEDWIDLPARVGDRLGLLVGAAPGQVLVCDSTTVNLYKLGVAALAARPGRGTIVGSATDFPTDRYVLEGLAEMSDRRLRLVDTPDDDPAALEAELDEVVDEDTALVCLSHVHYRSAARVDGGAITALAHSRGALVLWDLAHSAGSVPVDLDGWEADMAVGCSYKYLNAGPGAPGWLYVRRHLQDEIRQPIWGWFGRAEQFQMGKGYLPAPGVVSHMTGTPGVIALRSLDASLRLMERVGIEALWAKSERMTALLLDLIADELGPLGARAATPGDPARRGAHVTVSHPDARNWCRTLIDRKLVVPDFRPPDRLRLGPAPLYTRYVDCFDAVHLMAETLRGGLDRDGGMTRVT